MIHWTYKYFKELNTNELYSILSLRNAVFVVEQNCVYDDTDEKDLNCWHLCGWHEKKLVAYARIIEAGISFSEASIGRVITHHSYRRKGLGIELMKFAIQKTQSEFNTNKIRIGAQSHLIKFYNQLGFFVDSEEYLEDGIPHVEMVKIL